MEFRRLWETWQEFWCSRARARRKEKKILMREVVAERHRPEPTPHFRRRIGTVLAACFGLLAFTACDLERRKSDAELGLTPQQSAGRKLYDNYCDRCHRPYSTKGKKGPGLKGMFQHPYLPVSGLPANDERVSEIVRLGRKEMPGYSQTLSAQDLQDLLAYMHTL